jgi:TRAP-type C4-dicarboxylate transport system permease small subunit
MLIRFFSWYDRFLVAASYLPGILAALMVVGIGTDILMRNIGFNPIIWMLDAEEYSLLLIAMSGTATVLRMGRHIKVDVALVIMPPRLRTIVEFVGHGFCLIISLITVYYGIAATITAYLDKSTFYVSIPIKEWVPLCTIPLAFTLTAIESLRSLVLLRASARGALTHTPQEVL